MLLSSSVAQVSIT